MTEKEIIERTKILLQAYIDMCDGRNHNQLLSQCMTYYDDCNCDSHCLKDDMTVLLDDIILYERDY